jgi:hypothetical protein
MPLMLSKLYQALRARNVPKEEAREAAEEVARMETTSARSRLA